jgi:DNA-binding CsgD family transcriptional regulator
MSSGSRVRRMRLRVPKPARSFLEMDELVALTDAAAEQDAGPAGSLRSAPQPGTTAAQVAERLASGMRPAEIAADLKLAKSTVSYHARRLGVEGRQEYVGRRAVVATLGGAGLRASELCDVRLRDVRLHDSHGARLRIPDAKTEAGIREVQLSPDLVDELLGHIERLRAAGLPTGPDGYLFPNTTPHSLRRTYISIALVANRFDVMWVMSPVGHADSKMTTDVYAQLQQRARRDHGQAFDALVRRAREHLYGTSPRPTDSRLPRDLDHLERGKAGAHWATHWATKAETATCAFQAPDRRNGASRALVRRSPERRDPDSNRGHHDFQSWDLRV